MWRKWRVRCRVYRAHIDSFLAAPAMIVGAPVYGHTIHVGRRLEALTIIPSARARAMLLQYRHPRVS